jgi:hypothetical protein
MNWPEVLLHVVGGDYVGGASESIQQTVFEAENGRGSYDGRLRVNATSDLLALGLGTVEL